MDITHVLFAKQDVNTVENQYTRHPLKYKLGASSFFPAAGDDDGITTVGLGCIRLQFVHNQLYCKGTIVLSYDSTTESIEDLVYN